MSIITLTTDFGVQDAYVAAMKGVILSINPQATLVDITHLIPPQDIQAGAFVLCGAVPYFPRGTVHLGVVDPGVGADRRAIALTSQGHFFVGPDNGLFTDFLDQEAKVVELTKREFFLERVSQTFHGRDIFAPVAAHISLGTPLERLGPEINDPVRLPRPEPEVTNNKIIGQVIQVDRFGNLITNIPAYLLMPRIKSSAPQPVIYIRGKSVQGLARSYAETEPGGLMAIIGSMDLLEISLPGESAAHALKVQLGERVEVFLEQEYGNVHSADQRDEKK